MVKSFACNDAVSGDRIGVVTVRGGVVKAYLRADYEMGKPCLPEVKIKNYLFWVNALANVTLILTSILICVAIFDFWSEKQSVLFWVLAISTLAVVSAVVSVGALMSLWHHTLMRSAISEAGNILSKEYGKTK